jgi:enoyl-CoA hydratase
VTEPPTDPQIIVERRSRAGVITLNRPQAINALNHDMILAITATLDVWRTDPTIEVVVLRGAGERGFCAGGDVVAIAALARDDPAAGRSFWRDEYALDLAIARFPIPVVAIMDGIVLGGGMGLAAHASHRVVTERSRLGMPEVTIGFVPDVGGTHLLSRAPGELGTHLALTGGMATAGDALALGLADALVPEDRLPELLERLTTEPVDAAIAALAVDPPPSPLIADRAVLDAAYAHESVAQIIDALRAANRDTIADVIASKSPLALSVTLASLRRARAESDLAEALEREYRVSSRFLAEHDFAEGIRAQLVDKDRAPRWSPATLDDVAPTRVAAFFELLDAEPLSA